MSDWSDALLSAMMARAKTRASATRLLNAAVEETQAIWPAKSAALEEMIVALRARIEVLPENPTHWQDRE